MATAQDSLRQLASTTGAACFDILYFNNHLFTGNGNTLEVFDATNPEIVPYNMVFEHWFVSNIDEMERRGNMLYIAANHAGLSKWDISNPTSPQLITTYFPDSLSHAAFDISFYGDSLLVCYKKSVAVFFDHGSWFELLSKFAFQSGNGQVRGGDVKDSLFAMVLSLGGNTDGVYVFDVRNLAQLSFFPQTFCDPEDVVFGQNTPLLHVLGGTQSNTNPFNPYGCFYSLNLSIPTQPTLAFYDTVKTIFGLGISAPMKAEVKHDTIYVATQAAMKPDWQFPDPAYGQVYVYDATDENNVQFITPVWGGLWHFDVALQDHYLQVASEWYGVQTMDISDLDDAVYIGRTPTGGWNWGSDANDEKLVVAGGGYGFKVFDITDPSNPVLEIIRNPDSNFCKNIEISQDGQYIFGYYLTNEGMRVYDINNPTTVLAAVPANHGDRDTWKWNDKLISLNKPTLGAQSVHVIDVANPLAPFKDTSFNYNSNDLLVDENGLLFLTKNTAIEVFDIANNFALVASQPGQVFQNFKTMAKYHDSLFVYVTNRGLVRYIFSNQVFVEDTVISLPFGEPQFMAADRYGLYLSSLTNGLFSFNKKSLAQTGYYRHSMEFVHEHVWGVQDLFCENELIFLVEFFGQTTILTHKNGQLNPVSEDQFAHWPPPPRVVQLPGIPVTRIWFRKTGTGETNGRLFDSSGRLVKTLKTETNHFDLPQSSQAPGVYFFEISPQGQSPQTVRIVVGRQ